MNNEYIELNSNRVILFSGDNTDSFYLSDSILNYKYIEIFGYNKDGVRGCAKLQVSVGSANAVDIFSGSVSETGWFYYGGCRLSFTTPNYCYIDRNWAASIKVNTELSNLTGQISLDYVYHITSVIGYKN